MPNKLTSPRRRVRHIGPGDHKRHVSLAEFDLADGQEGYLYELNKGVIEVTNIPHRRHFLHLADIRDQLIVYKTSTQGIIHAVGGSDNTKNLIESEQSERHPDIAVYTSPMPGFSLDLKRAISAAK